MSWQPIANEFVRNTMLSKTSTSAEYCTNLKFSMRCTTSSTSSNSRTITVICSVNFQRNGTLQRRICNISRLYRLEMFLVGLTGGIATGKSTVSKKFRELGCPVIDADKLAKDVVEPGRPALAKIRENFGDDILHEDGTLNRTRLATIIFTDAEKRTLLNSITHPEIYKQMLWLLVKYFLLGHSFVVLDTPLLFESGKMVPYMTYTVVVSCSEGQQLKRLIARNRFSQNEAESRINAQMALAEKCKRATYIIDNSGTVEMTETQVVELHKKLCRSRAHWRIRTILAMAVIFSVYFLNYLYNRFTSY